MKRGDNFFNLYNHDFVRVAVGIPAVRVADPAFNASETIALMKQAADRKALLALFPELGLSAYTCDDLFQQRALLDSVEDALGEILVASRELNLVGVVGMPVRIDHLLFNCAVVVCRGAILGAVPKTFLPNYREFYEARQFAPADSARSSEIDLAGQRGVPFGTALLFRHRDQPQFVFSAEICEDLWTPIPPSAHAALAGATVLLNLSASNITIAKADYRRDLVGSQSARCLAAYLYSAAGPGESTTDLAWDGHALIYENGTRLAESERFFDHPQLICADLDLERLVQERMRQTSFGDSIRRERPPRGVSNHRVLDPLPRAELCFPTGPTNASPMFHPTPHVATSDAPRFTRFRCRAWPRGSARPASSGWCWAFRAGSIRRRRC